MAPACESACVRVCNVTRQIHEHVKRVTFQNPCVGGWKAEGTGLHTEGVTCARLHVVTRWHTLLTRGLMIGGVGQHNVLYPLSLRVWCG